MTKAKQRFIVISLAIAILASTIITVNFTTILSVNADPGYMEYPQITVLTHGLGGSATHWSSENGEGKILKEDYDSLVYKLSQKAGGSYIYRAQTSGGKSANPSYTLYEGYSGNSATINNVSKHIIILFESLNNNESNDVVYKEFSNMLNDIIARVKSLNQGQKHPKVNLIGHSRGGITNLQYALEFPENVDSLISIGTPYFGSAVAEFAGEIIYGKSDGLRDVIDSSLYDSYYTTWTRDYEKKYKNINSIAIGGVTTIDYQCAVLSQYVDDIFSNTAASQYEKDRADLADGFIELLSYYENEFKELLAKLGAGFKYPEVVNQHPQLAMFTKEEFIALVRLLGDEVFSGNWYSDVFVPVDSHQGESSNKNYYFSKYVREFDSSLSLSPKRAANDLPIIHNLETYDAEIHNYILKNMLMKVGDRIDNEIGFVGKVEQVGDENNKYISTWQIKIRNTHEEARVYAYNAKLCFLDDAKKWKGLTDIVAFCLEPGETKIVDIIQNFNATCIAISSINGSNRYIKYAEPPLAFHYFYKMTSFNSTTAYYSYTQNNMKASIVGKNGGAWLVSLTNKTGSAQSFYYNAKMCYAGDAQNWTGLSDIAQTETLADGATTILAISGNASATSIAISYIRGSTRYIFYAYDLNTAGTLSSFGSSKPYYSETKNGMKVSIAGKNSNTWLIELTNNTGSGRTFYYNSKLCYAGDAEKWSGLSDEKSIYLANGAVTSIPLEITENYSATSIAISYMDGVYRKIFYAYDLNKSGTMSAFESTIDTSAPPDECLAEGSLITLADGSQKAVEELTGDELLLVWNMETGTFDTAPIIFIDSDAIGHYEVIDLGFSDGTSVEVIYEHGFWDVDLNKYVYLDENAAQYIGHRFNKQTVNADGSLGYTEVTLTDVEISVEVTTAWSPVTYGHLCYYVNGMLSMPGGITGLFNIFEIDGETMTIDEEAYLADIAEYGLFTYEEFYETYPVTEDVFEAFNGRYLKVAIGKGMITYERLGELIERYSEFF